MFTAPQIIVAHRGGVVDQTRSENSFKALEEAIRRGYTHVEIDARITLDGHVVCFHNDELLEEAGIDGKISEMPLEAVIQTQLTRSKEKIPTFDAYCAQCAGRIGVMIDLKGCKAPYIEQYTQQIENALSKHNLLADALLLINKFPKDNQAEIAQHFLGKSKVSWRHPLEITKQAALEDPDFANKYYIFNHGADFSRDNTKAYQELGLDVIVSINTHHYDTGDPIAQGESHLKQMLNYGVNGVQIDSCFDTKLPR